MEVDKQLVQKQFTVVAGWKGKGIKRQCIHCKHEFAGGYTRQHEHLLGTGNQVKACTGNTPGFLAVKQALQKRLAAEEAATTAKERVEAAAAAADQHRG